jgi:methionyl-tRNA formyltransferase
MSRIRVCFLGTPHFAEVHLEALLSDSQFEVVGVVTQPDRPAGRKMQLSPSPVKLKALNANIPVLTPENLKKQTELLEQIKKWQADVAVVVAFGQILSEEFLQSFKFGAVNVHGSLLPRWRGAAPIQRALEAGDRVSGVCLQKMVKQLDAGAIIGERKVELNDSIDAVELYERLSFLGCELLKTELPQYIRGEITLRDQDESQVTYATKIDKKESELDLNQSAEKIHNKVRAFSMGPGTFILVGGKRLKILKTQVVPILNSNLKPGTIYTIFHDELVLQTQNGGLKLIEVQPESKPRMIISDFLKSYLSLNQIEKGDRFV